MTQRPSGLVFFVGGLGLAVAACQASASAHVATSDEARANADPSGDPPSATSAPAPVAAPSPPAPPPAGTCPLRCHAAFGADRVDVSPDDLTQISSAVEPVLSRMRACTTADAWRRHGSPTLHLRVGPDGLVHEVDVDPHHVYDLERSCIDDAARTSPLNLALPGRKAVRCVERCQRR